MFAVLTRPIQRRTVYHASRCLSKNASPPRPPPSSSGNDKTEIGQTSDQASQPESSDNAPKINTSELPNLDFVPAELKEEPKRTGARSAKDTLTTGEKQRRHALRLTWAVLLLGLGASGVYMGREWEKDELEQKRMVRIFPNSVLVLTDSCLKRIEDAPSTRWGRTRRRVSDFFGVRPCLTPYTSSLRVDYAVSQRTSMARVTPATFSSSTSKTLYARHFH